MFIRKIIFRNNIAPRYVDAKDLKKMFCDDTHQIVQIISYKKWQEEHILFSTRISPDNFSKEIFTKLDPNKKIVLYGEYHSMAEYYRVLDYCKFNVYLIK